jgi:hypothetical protein
MTNPTVPEDVIEDAVKVGMILTDGDGFWWRNTALETLVKFAQLQRHRERNEGEAVPERVQDIIHFCMTEFRDFSDKDWRDHGFRISTYKKAVTWLRRAFTSPPSQPVEQVQACSNRFDCNCPKHYQLTVRNSGEQALREAADIAANACLVPPDGGSPTPNEVELCGRISAAILALITNSDKENSND